MFNGVVRTYSFFQDNADAVIFSWDPAAKTAKAAALGPMQTRHKSTFRNRKIAVVFQLTSNACTRSNTSLSDGLRSPSRRWRTRGPVNLMSGLYAVGAPCVARGACSRSLTTCTWSLCQTARCRLWICLGLRPRGGLWVKRVFGTKPARSLLASAPGYRQDRSIRLSGLGTGHADGK